MLDIRVELPRPQLLKILRTIDGKAVLYAETQALNRTANNVSKVAIKEVSREMGIKRSEIAKRGRRIDFRGTDKYGGINRTKKAARRRLFAVVSGRGRPFNIKRFKAKIAKDGATHEAWGRSQFAEGVWRLKNGAFVVRSGKSFRSVFGPGITHVMEYPHVERKLEKEALAKFDGHFATAIRYAFSSQFHGRR